MATSATYDRKIPIFDFSEDTSRCSNSKCVYLVILTTFRFYSKSGFRHNYDHTVFNAQVPARLSQTASDHHGNERGLTPSRGYDNDAPVDNLGAPPHHRAQTLEQHVNQQRQQGPSSPNERSSLKGRKYTEDIEGDEKSKGGCFPQSKQGRANCIACVVCGFIVLLVITGTIAVVVWRVFYCQLKDSDSIPGLGAPNFFMGCKGRNSSFCGAYFGYEYNGTKKDGSACCRDQDNYLCEYPTVGSLPSATPANQLEVMTFNIFERPYFMGREGQRERTCRIPRLIFNEVPTVEVIGFQELFTEGCWGGMSSMREMLKQHGFIYSTRNVEEGHAIVNGGTFIASRWPIEVEKSYGYEERNLKQLAGFIPKGVNYAKVKKTSGGVDKIYHIFNTHFGNARGEVNDQVRESQATEMRKFIDDQNIPAGEPVIILGDFNVDYHTQEAHFNKVFNETLDAVLPTNISSLEYTYNPQTNALLGATTESTSGEWLDYIMYLADHQLPTTGSFRVMEAKWPTPMRFCWDADQLNIGAYRFPDSAECHETQEFTELSDHFPVIADFIFPL